MDLFELGIKADTRALRRGQKDLDNFARTGERTEKRVGSAMGRMEKRVKGVREEALRLNNVLAAAGIIQFTRSAIRYADAWTQVNNQLKQVTQSEQELNQTRMTLLGIAKSTNNELGSTVKLYSELFRSTRDLNVSQERIADVTKTINNLFKAGGKPVSETAGAIRQLSQGLAAGALRGDEFNSVAEGAPRIMDALAASLRMNRGELRAFAATGGITSKIMVEALEAYREEAQRLADATDETFGQKMTNARTNVTKFAGEANALTASIDLFGDGLEGLSENLDTVVTVGEGLAVLLAGKMAGGFAIATQQAVAYQLTLARMAGVSASAATGQLALAGATRTASTAMALMGGPAGALALVAFGIHKWSEGLTEATRLGVSAEPINKKLASSYSDIADQLERIGKVGDSVVSGQDLRTAAAIDQLEKQRAQLERDLSALKMGGTGLPDREVNKRIAITTELLRDVNVEFGNIVNPEKTGGGVASGIAELEAQINKQIEAYSLGAEAVAEYERNQKIANETARLAVGPLEGEAAKIMELVKARMDAADAFDAQAKKQREFEQLTEKLDPVGAINKDHEKQIKLINEQAESETRRLELIGLQNEAYENQLAQLKGLNKEQGAGVKDARSVMHAHIGDIQQGLAAVQSFAEEGSKEYQALAVASAAAAVAAAATAPPPLGFANAAAMASSLAGLGIAIGNFGGGDSGYDLAAVQAAQGTGSVLGDATAQSESIANAIESMERNSEIEVGTSAQMLRQLQMLNQNIAGLGTILARQFGDFTTGDPSTSQLFADNGLTSFSNNLAGALKKTPIVGDVNDLLEGLLGVDVLGLANDILGFAFDGLFGKTTASVVDSGIAIQAQSLGELMADGLAGASLDAVQFATIRIRKKSIFGTSTSYRRREQELGGDINRQLGLVVGGLYESILSAAQAAFGLNVSDHLNAAKIGAVDISLRGLSGSERTDALQAVFGRIGDTMAGVIPRLSEFQLAGEGLFETLNRVASDVERAKFQLEAFGLTTGDVFSVVGESNVALELMRDAFAANAGAAGILIERFGGSEEELVTFAGRVLDLRDTFEFMGLGIDSLTESMIRGARGSESLANGVKSFIDNFLSPNEQVSIQRSRLEKDLGQVGLSLPATRDAYRALLESLDLSSMEGQRLAGVLFANADAASEYFDAAQDAASATDSLINGLRQFSRQATLSTLSPAQSLAFEQQRFFGLANAARGGDRDAAGQLVGAGQSVLGLASEQATSRFELDAITATVTGAVSAVADTLEAEPRQIDLLESQLTVLEQIRDGDSLPTPSSTISTIPANASTNDRLARLELAINKLAETNNNGFIAVATHTSKTAGYIEQWEDDGLPPEREVA